MKSLIKTIHPFPARMAPELVWDELPKAPSRLRILDPMMGSGTTLVTAKLRGHQAVGYDRDPLAVLIARSWLTNVHPLETANKAAEVVKRARARARKMSASEGYPRAADDETKSFVRYWFDSTNRIQLAALAETISRIHDHSLRDLMWCGLSRLIITKNAGVSLAMDISHSRPHRTYDRAPIRAFANFEWAVRRIIGAAPFTIFDRNKSLATANLGDARQLPIDDESVDMVITSPPYLNAIDYVRGHKFSLIWMGHSIKNLRNLRATTVGTENTGKPNETDPETERLVGLICDVDMLSTRYAGILRKYVQDVKAVLSETRRVLRPNGKAVFVIGNCNIDGSFVENSKCIEELANALGLVLTKTKTRPLPENRRYLPPPTSSNAGKALKKRLREEVILTLTKN
jgi:DNA modification methylase